jgi:nicotinamidase-related amidase
LGGKVAWESSKGGVMERTAVLCIECQRGVIGADSVLPVLRDDATPLIARLDRLLRAARSAKLPIVHATFEGHLGGRPTGTAPLWRTLDERTAGWAPGHPATEVLPELSDPGDLVLPRHHGLWPTSGSELIPLLRGFGVNTVVLTGVSVNVALPLTAADLGQAGFEVLVPRDAVAGTPVEYAEQALRHTMAMLARLTTVDALIECWVPG